MDNSNKSKKTVTKPTPRSEHKIDHKSESVKRTEKKVPSTREKAHVKERESSHPKEKEPSKKRETQKEIETPSTSNEVVSVKDLQEYSDLRNSGLVVVDFNTTWCGPCKNFAPVFDEIAKNYPGVKFLSVDAESIEHEDTESIKSVPTFKIFLNGLLKREFSGIDREKLERYIERYQIQIMINGRTQRSFPPETRDKIVDYMSMLHPE